MPLRGTFLCCTGHKSNNLFYRRRDAKVGVPYRHIFTLVPLKKFQNYPNISSISFSENLFILSKSIASM